jgi:hypothetical protein
LLWLEVLDSELTNSGSNSLTTLNALIETSKLFYKKGEYELALEQCEKVEHKISEVPTSKEYKKKRFEMMCLRAGILTDMN